MGNNDTGEFPGGTHPELERYMQGKGWEFEVYKTAKRTELKVNPCPLCGNTSKNFEINAATGLYRCWACNAQGTFETLQRNLGDSNDGIARIERAGKPGAGGKPKKNYKTIPLEKFSSAEKKLMAGDLGVMEYLHDRGITDDTIAHFHLGACRTRSMEPALLIPHLRGEDTVVLAMYRTIPPAEKQYLRESDMESVLFNENALHEASGEIVVCEGQLDAMSVWQAGCAPVVSVSTGAATDWPNEWIELISAFNKITMVYDGDEAGRSGARIVRQRVGEDKVWIADLPDGKDMNQILIDDGEEGVLRAISLARPAPVSGISTVEDGIIELQEQIVDGDGEGEGFPWFSAQINTAIGNAEFGDLVEIMGAAGTGKTTLMLQQARFLATELHIPVLVTCMEMRMRRLVRKTIQSLYQITKEEVDLNVLGDAIMAFDGIPLYFATPPRDANVGYLVDQATSAFKRLGVRAWIVDNLIILTESAADPLREQAVVTRDLKGWAMDFNNVIYLLAHPRKVDNGVVAGSSDMRGNGAIVANADILMNLHRKSLAPTKEERITSWDRNSDGHLLEPVTSVHPLKVRDNEARIGWVYFHGAQSFFRDAEGDDFEAAKQRAAAV